MNTPFSHSRSFLGNISHYQCTILFTKSYRLVPLENPKIISGLTRDRRPFNYLRLVKSRLPRSQTILVESGNVKRVGKTSFFSFVFSLPIFSRRFSPCVSLRPREDHDQRLFSRAWYHCCVTPSRRYRLANILCSSWRFPHVLEY